MENNERVAFEPPCFIGSTKFSAGIFLSRQITERKLYADHVKLEEFKSYYLAETEFKTRYPGLIERDEFRLNKLFRVKEEPFYAIFWTSEKIVMTNEKNMYTNIKILLPDDWQDTWSKSSMTYEQAQDFGRARFMRYYKNYRLYLPFKLRLNIPVDIDDVINCKNVLY